MSNTPCELCPFLSSLPTVIALFVLTIEHYTFSGCILLDQDVLGYSRRLSQTTIFSWLNKEFISPRYKPVTTQRLSPKCTLMIKDLCWATEVLIGQVQLSKIRFYGNQLKQDNWALSALLNIYTSGCKYLFTYHLFAIFFLSCLLSEELLRLC